MYMYTNRGKALYNELLKAGLTYEILRSLSYHTQLGKSLVNSLRHFDKELLFDDINKVINFYNNSEIMDELAIDYRIKSEDSCLRKYDKFYPDMRVEKTFNDVLGFRMLCDNYDGILNHDNIDKIRIVDMSQGKANDDGYRGVHLYFQLDHSHYPVEIQMNTYYDRQINNWLHKYLYKKNYPDDIGLKLRKLYENGKILNENMFREVLQNVLSDCKRI